MAAQMPDAGKNPPGSEAEAQDATAYRYEDPMQSDLASMESELAKEQGSESSVSGAILNELVKSYGFRRNPENGDWSWSVGNIGQSFKEDPIWTTIDYLALAVPVLKWGTATAAVSKGTGAAGKALKAGEFAGQAAKTRSGRLVGKVVGAERAKAAELYKAGPSRLNFQFDFRGKTRNIGLSNPITTQVDDEYLGLVERYGAEVYEQRAIAKSYERERLVEEGMRLREAADINRRITRSGITKAQRARFTKFLDQGVGPDDDLVRSAFRGNEQAMEAYKNTWEFRNSIHEAGFDLNLFSKDTYLRNLKSYAPRIAEEWERISAARGVLRRAGGGDVRTGTASGGSARFQARKSKEALFTQILDPRVSVQKMAEAGQLIAQQRYAQGLASSVIAKDADEIMGVAEGILKSGDTRMATLHGLSSKKVNAAREIVENMEKVGRSVAAEEMAELLGWRRIDDLYKGKNLPGYVERLPEELRGKWLDPAAAEDVMGSLKFMDESTMMGDFYKSALSFFRASKCVVPGTRILTEHGYVQIEDAYEYKDGFVETPEDAARIWTPNEGWDRPVQVFRQRDVETIRVELRDGTVIEGTPEHPIQCEGELVKLGDLNIGDAVDACLGGPFPADRVRIPWNPWRGCVGGSSSIEFDEDLAELIGWILGDGQVSAQYKSPCHVRISIGYQDLQWSGERLSTLCDRIGINYTIRTEKNVRSGAKGPLSVFSIHNANLGRLLEHLGLFDGKRKRPIVPEPIFRSPQSVVCAFIRGLFDTDGCAHSDGTFDFISVHEGLARDVHLLLKWLGVQSTVRLKRRAGTSYIQGRECRTQDVWGIGAWSRIPRARAVELGLFSMPRKLERIRARLDDRLRKPQPWKNKVTSIEHRRSDFVYDVCRSDGTDHLFIAAGLVNHNTAYNPATHVRNALGASVFHHLTTGGVPTLVPRRGLRAFFDEDENYKAARAAGIVGASFDNEIREGLKEGLQGIDAKFPGQATAIDWMGESNVAKFMQKGAGKAERFYRSIDEAWKLDAWIQNTEKYRKRGMPLDEARKAATLDVNKFSPNFVMHSEAGDALRKAVPFASFTTEALRVWKNALVEKPHLAFFWNHAVESMSQTFGAMSGFSSEQIEKAQEALPKYQQGKKNLMLPFDVDGQPRFLDLSYMIPMANLAEAQQGESLFFEELIDPTTNPLLNAATAFATQEDPFSGRKIQPEFTERQLGIPVEGKRKRKVVGLAEHMASMMLPPLVPPGYAGTNIIEALRGQKNPATGESLEDGVFRTIAQNVAGLRTFSPDVESQVLNVRSEQWKANEKMGNAWRRWEFAKANDDPEAMERERKRIVELKKSQGHEDAEQYFERSASRRSPFSSMSTKQLKEVLGRAEALGELSPKQERIRQKLEEVLSQRRNR